MWILGIDVSKDELAVRLQNEIGEFKEGTFTNSTKGFNQLRKWIKPVKLAALHACMEATNVYWEEVALYLHEHGAAVSVVNPMRIKGYAQSQMQRNKTDQLDARVIADFCAATPDLKQHLWVPPTPEQSKLRALVRHRDALIKARTQHTNRLKTCREDAVKQSLQAVIATLNEQIDQMTKQIRELIDQDPTLKQDRDLLLTIVGIGERSAEHILAELQNLANYDSARAAAADVGLTPSHHESGSTVRRRPRLSKIGKSSLRGALYLPALSALQHNPLIRDFASRLEQRGKARMVIVGAVMRKLVHIAYGVLKHRTPFDPQHRQIAHA